MNPGFIFEKLRVWSIYLNRKKNLEEEEISRGRS